MERIKYLALGDSYTSGTAIAYPENFPNQLSDRIREHKDIEVDVKIVAQNAWRTDDLLRGMKRADLADKYDLVSLLIGVNNQYQALPLADFEKDFRKLLDIALLKTEGDRSSVFVLSIPNYGYTPFGAEKKEQITIDLEKFNGRSKEICEEYSIDYFDVTNISLEAETNPSFRAKDDLHPSPKQYGIWLDSFLNKVMSKIG